MHGDQARMRKNDPTTPETRTKQAGGEGYPLTQAERGPGTGAGGCSVSKISRAELAKGLSWKLACVLLCPSKETSGSPAGPC